MEESEKRDAEDQEGVEAVAPAPSRRPAGVVKWVVLASVVLVLGVADQLTKQWAQEDLQQRPGRNIQLVSGYVGFTYVRNPGAAWGFLSGPKYAGFRRPFFVTISIVAMIFIGAIFFYLQRGQGLMMTALSLIMSGAIGNFIDRVRLNYVIDFIDIRIPLPGDSLFYWPKFNVADVAITLGVLVLVLEMFIGNKPEDGGDEPEEDDADLTTDEELDWEKEDGAEAMDEAGDEDAAKAKDGAADEEEAVARDGAEARDEDPPDADPARDSGPPSGSGSEAKEGAKPEADPKT